MAIFNLPFNIPVVHSSVYYWTMEEKSNQSFQKLFSTDSELTIAPMNPKLPLWTANLSESLWAPENKSFSNRVHLMLGAIEFKKTLWLLLSSWYSFGISSDQMPCELPPYVMRTLLIECSK